MARRTTRKPVVWLPDVAATATVASLAAGAQVLALDMPLDHPGSGEDYGPGAVVGLRIRMWLSAGAAITTGTPKVVVLLLPQGLATPTVNTSATLKQNERLVWGIWTMVPEEGSSVNRFVLEIAPRTARRFEPGDRLCVIVHNDSGTAFAAGAIEKFYTDMYLRED